MAGYDGSLKFDTEISEKGFNSGITKLGSLAKGGLSVLTGAIGSVTAALGAGAVAGLKYNASIETYQTSFEVMTGSAEKAAEVIDRLKKVGAETPFELPDLADTTQLLMNYGLTADEGYGQDDDVGGYLSGICRQDVPYRYGLRTDVISRKSPARGCQADDRSRIQPASGDQRVDRRIHVIVV